MNFRRSLVLLLVASLAVLLAACGSSNSGSTPATLSWSAAQYTPPTSMTAGTTQGLAVTITNGSANAMVNWSATCSQASCGTFNPGSTSSTVVTQYTAPSTVPSGGLTVTVTATYSGSGTATPLSANITVNPVAVTLAFTSGFTPPTSMTAGTTAGLAVTITNGSANSVVNWTVSCSQASCGTFSAASTGSTVVTTYTAPSSVPAGGLTVMVTATYSGTGTATPLSANITINPVPAISVTLSTPPPSSMLVLGTANVVATVTNDTQGVNWSCMPATACGGFTSPSTASGQTNTYTAPSIVPQSTTGAVTITATSVTNTSAYASATITITSNIAVTFASGFAPPTSAAINQQFEVAASVANDPNPGTDGNGVNWTVTCGSAGACGTFSSTTTTTTPTTYTAPAAIPTNNTVTITATSVTDYTKTVSGTVTITQPPPLLPNGNYVFQVVGEDTNGAPSFTPFNVSGVFTVNTNAITGGEEDFVDSFNGWLPEAILGANSNSSIAATADGNLQIILDTGDTSNIGAGTGVETFNITLTSANSGLISWFDGFATGTGTFSVQDPTAASTTPLGGYALLSSGNESTTANGTSGGTVGIFNSAFGGIPVVAADGSISGFFDLNDTNAAVQTKVAFAGTSNVSAPDAFGRVLFTLDSALPEIQLAGYIANASAISTVEIGDAYGAYTGGGSITAGTALAQGTNTGGFSKSTLSGSSYAFAVQGDDTQPFAQFAGSLSFAPLNPSDLAVSGNATLNDIASQTSGAVSGTLTIDSTGRATIFTLSLGGVSGHIQLYLDGNGNGLVLTMHPSFVLAGPAFLQTATANLATNYAMNGTGVSSSTLNPWSAVGPVLNIASGTIGAGSFTDFNYFGETLTTSPCTGSGSTCTDVPLSGTLTTSTGTITGVGADSLVTAPSSSDTFVVYPIDSAHAFAIENDATQLGLLYLAPYVATPSAGTIQPATSKKNGKTVIGRTRAVTSQTAK